MAEFAFAAVDSKVAVSMFALNHLDGPTGSTA